MSMQMVNAVTGKPYWGKIVRFVPILGWLPHYRRDWLRPDFIAGVTLWGTGVPTALAYAQMAHPAPEPV